MSATVAAAMATATAAAMPITASIMVELYGIALAIQFNVPRQMLESCRPPVVICPKPHPLLPWDKRVPPWGWRDAWDPEKPWLPWLLWHWKTFLLNIIAIMCINWMETICTWSPTSRELTKLMAISEHYQTFSCPMSCKISTISTSEAWFQMSGNRLLIRVHSWGTKQRKTRHILSKK